MIIFTTRSIRKKRKYNSNTNLNYKQKIITKINNKSNNNHHIVAAEDEEEEEEEEDAIILMGDEHVFQLRWNIPKQQLYWVIMIIYNK